ncbi:hypothetical protein LOTGIDRAFT_113866 [Lottia gigantea]|uniref:Adenylate kinase isoenzyme 5 n=1 Tax=Lottia gigantea TaxID=225164 RepID=V4A4N5_LOTGI|nr:hypothetical protein LOTGIDRAFT_113866 [Lottia gigantea]ESO98838.1 hypothetical protein LOTGIDRAFT_113866 [Lottia gigantea]
MSSEDAKSYLSKREVPRLFESMMTGLMFHRPDDHIEYLIECLQKVKSDTPKSISWDLFVDLKRSPLPPITSPVNGKTEDRTNIPHPPTKPKPSSREKDSQDVPDSKTILQEDIQRDSTIKINVKDTGRKEGLPQAPVVFFAGGPGSGKGTQCKKLVARYPDFVHLSMGDILRTEITTHGTVDAKWDMISTLLQKGEMAPREMTIDLLLNAMKEHKDAQGFIIEGFPRDVLQLEEYFTHIGGLGFAIVLDCEEYYLQKRLVERGEQTERIDDNLTAISNRLNFFKQNTLPVLRYIDDEGKLVVVQGDRDEAEIFYDLCKVFDMAFYGKQPQLVSINQTNYNLSFTLS